VSTVIFNNSFTVHQPYQEGWEHETSRSPAAGGREVRKARLPVQGRFRVRLAQLRFPPNAPSTFEAFFEARQGAYDTWLYLPVLQANRSITAEAVATAGAGETDFPLDSKHIKASTLTVYEDGTPQAAYTLTGNYTAPVIEFDAAPGAGVVITADYDRYIPVRFDADDYDFDPRMFSDAGDASSVLYIRGLTWRQDYAGSHLV
jgi:hypothetical protein